ncbi:MAG TPA: MEDS domain-containing protein [Candidatus Limnocylindria bacterium]|nr:MEDS domain-containing protein [Candidatus Limnocylindria bacterium]
MKTFALGIDDTVVRIPAHIGLFYNAELELRQLRLQFLRPAVEDRHQGIMLLTLPGRASSALHDLEADMGVSLDTEVRNGRVVSAHYDPDADLMLEKVRDAREALVARGHSVIRVFAQVALGDPGFPLAEDYFWAESRVNIQLTKTHEVLVCAYDLSQLPDPALIHGGLETHPSVVIGGRFAKNPAYIAPTDYMRSLLFDISSWRPGT